MLNFDDIIHARLYNQRLAATARGAALTPTELVAWLGAAQAQDFAGAKWSLGQRLWPTTDAAIEEAFNRGDILRTHVLRPTWHFVAPADIRWLLALTAPHVHQINGTMYRQVGMDSPTLRRSIDILASALEGGNQLTRDELRERIEAAGVPVGSGLTMTYIMMNAELDGVVCSGPRRGKQFTYMLLDERAPNARTMGRDEGLAELVRRYFTSHGPATANDFARWSSLTLTETRRGLEVVRAELQQATIGARTYWFAGDVNPPRDPSPAARLVSIYDEYTIGYKDRSGMGDEETGKVLAGMGNALQNVLILDGQIAATWRRLVRRVSVTVELHPLRLLSGSENAAVLEAAQMLGEFLELPVELTS